MVRSAEGASRTTHGANAGQFLLSLAAHSAPCITPHPRPPPSRGRECAVRLSRGSGALDVGVHDLLVAGEVERDGKPVGLDLGDPAVAEFLVEDAVADGEAADRANLFAAPR